jgi:large-conductance mechanosensitive channel
MKLFKFFLYFLFCTQLTVAQDKDSAVTYDDSILEEQEILESDLETYKADDAFNYIEIEPEDNFIVRAYNTFVNWLGNIIRKIIEAIFGVGEAQGLIYFIFYILPYLILAFLIFILIRFFLRVNSRTLITGQKQTASFQFTEDEQIIKNEDINALIENAIGQKNYRLAIRYYYLLSLRYLTEKEVITWQQEKTNEDYITEIESDSIKNSFKNITRIYDYVWYGEFNVDQLRFESLKMPFESLNKSLKQK